VSEKTSFSQKLVTATESLLTWRLRRKLRIKEDKKKKHFLVDWLETFLSSALIVLLVNQYFFQAYVIPSGSMITTLEINDRIFVNKLVYGPELLPGIFKLPSPVQPVRGDIVIFESPQYLSQAKGTVYDLAQRLIFMLTLSLVDIDRDEAGNPRIRFLIKRSPVVGGDRARFVNGELELIPRGWKNWTKESEVKAAFGLEYPTRRMIEDSYYEGIDALAESKASVRLERVLSLTESSAPLITDQQNLDFDSLEVRKREQGYLISQAPHITEFRKEFFRTRTGMYIPYGWVLPLGDNRDNSVDGRFFGPVPTDKILGQSAFRFWPFQRIGTIN